MKPIIRPVNVFQNIIEGMSASGENNDVLHNIVSIYPRCHSPKSMEEHRQAYFSFFMEFILLYTYPLNIISSYKTVSMAL